MHRAKHRAGADADAAVLATTLLERFAVVPGPRPEPSAPRHSVDTPPARGTDGGSALFGAARTSPMLAVGADDTPTRDAAALFGGAPDVSDDDARSPLPDEGPLFGAARHARPRGRDAGASAVPGPRVAMLSGGFPAVLRSQPVGAALSVTVLGAAAAVTAVVAPPPTAVESTGSLAPVQGAAAPAPGPQLAVAAPAAHALGALPDEPTMQVDDLVTQVTAQMQAATRPYRTVAQSTQLSSPAALRKAAMTNALGKLGTPYRWGALGPNAFDCSGLVKWSFANAGRSLPRTSRAMATMGVRVAKADLQPGDLVFFYQPISHVGIYIGNGKIVHASRSGQPVKISDMSRMRFTMARRV